jgi:hypothetical protein
VYPNFSFHLLLSICLKMNKEATTYKVERAIKIKWYTLLFNDIFSDIAKYIIIEPSREVIIIKKDNSEN